jgi:hypothetical protein
MTMTARTLENEIRARRRSLSIETLATATLLSVLAPAFSGCSERESEAGGPGAEGPLYAINVRTYGTDFGDPISYIALASDLESGEVSLADALEIPGASSMWGIPESGELFLVSAENQTVTKYRLAAAGGLQPAGRLGLSGAGVTALVTEAIAFDGPTRGFLFDVGSAQALELDLGAMEITGSHDLSGMLIETAELTFLAEGGFHARGDHLIGAAYGSTAAFDGVARVSKVGFFDLSDGSIEVVEVPCGGLLYSFEAESGDWYFSTDPWVAGIHALDGARAPAPCMVRLPAGSRTFDPAIVALNDVTGGVTGGLIPGSNGTAYVRVLDQDVFPLTIGTDYLAPFSVSAWTTWRINLLHPASAVRVDRPHIAGGIKFATVDEQVYQNESSADFASTTLVRTTGEDAPAPGLVVPGVPWNILRVR